MPRFRYQAINETREKVSGHLDAETRAAAIAQLESTGLTNVTIEGKVDSSFDPAIYEAVESVEQVQPNAPAAQTPQVAWTDREIRTYGDTFTNLTEAGLPLESGLRALAEEIPSRRSATALREISNRLERGEELAKIVQSDSHPDVPSPLQELLKSGLETHKLARIFSNYLKYSRQAAELQRRIWTGLLYSLILLVVLAVIVTTFMVLLVPEFKEIFEGFDTELPNTTILIIDFSDFLVKYWAVILIVLTLLGLGARLYFWIRPARMFRARVVQSMPLVGVASRNASLATFCRLLSTLIEARVPLDLAVRVAGAGTQNPLLEESCQNIAETVRRGVSLHDAAKRQLIIPLPILNLFRHADRPIVFQDALRASGDAFEGESSIRAGLIPMVIEPLVLCGIGFVMTMAIAGSILPLIKLLNDLS